MQWGLAVRAKCQGRTTLKMLIPPNLPNLQILLSIMRQKYELDTLSINIEKNASL